jgi:2-desacetyl-2-hydroxyethyl bacteriochlorophyllide A dehydrogenase
MGHELAVEVIEVPPGSEISLGDICVVNPYFSCGHCIACRAGKPNCCVTLSVLGVHQDGGMAGLLSIPPGNLIRADTLTADECATVEFLAIGAHAVRRSGLTRLDRVLVVGAGPIGLGVALFACEVGAAVSVLDRDDERAASVKSIAPVEVIPADPAQSVSEVTSGEEFDVVFDATGSQQAMERGFDFVAHGGRYVLVGVVKNSIAFMDPDFHRKELTLYGSRNATNDDFMQVIMAIRHRSIPVDRLVTHRTSLAAAAEKIPLWAKQKAGLIKALIEIE